MNIEQVDQIKKAIITGIASDDELMELLTLKGGNAMNIIYKVSKRASYDLDYSMRKDISALEISVEEFKSRLEEVIAAALAEVGYRVIDFRLDEKPREMPVERQGFWGGYKAEFKLIPKGRYDPKVKVEELRKRAVLVAPGNKTRFPIDISKHEYVDAKNSVEVDGFVVHVYSPSMLVAEKLRAICQQMEEYLPVIGRSSPKNRTRDFYDIYTLCQGLKEIDTSSDEFCEILSEMFRIKKVGIGLLSKIEERYTLYAEGFDSIKDTISAEEQEDIQDFKVYHQYVVDLISPIKGKLGI